MSKPSVAIIFHSGFGHTAKLAESVAQGVNEVAAGSALLVPVAEWEKHEAAIEQADAIIFGTPTYMGSASAQFKTFMDATSKLWYGQKWKDKLAAGFTNSASQSGDKLSTLQQLATFAMQHGMIWVSLGLLPGNNSTKGSVNDLNRIGSYLGAMAQSNADQGADEAPIKSDRLTAEHLGRRVAQQVARFKTRG